MLPEFRVKALEFVSLFKQEWKANPPRGIRDKTLRTQYMLGTPPRRAGQGDYGILGNMGKHIKHIQVESEYMGLDQYWLYFYDPKTGDFDDSADRPWRPWRIVVAIEHENENIRSRVGDNFLKLMHVDAPLKVHITYGYEEGRPGVKWTMPAIEKMLKGLLGDASDLSRNEYLLCFGEGEWNNTKWMWENTRWTFSLFDPEKKRFTRL